MRLSLLLVVLAACKAQKSPAGPAPIIIKSASFGQAVCLFAEGLFSDDATTIHQSSISSGLQS
jgi:hypothetical protein